MICGITGRRPRSLPWGYDESDARAVDFKNRLKYRLGELIESGYNVFNIGMAQGVDTYIFEILRKFRDDGIYANLELCAYVPSRDFAERWNYNDRRRYQDMLSSADSITYVSEKFGAASAHMRNMAIVDNSDIILAVYDGVSSGGTYRTIEYAKKRGVKVVTELI